MLKHGGGGGVLAADIFLSVGRWQQDEQAGAVWLLYFWSLFGSRRYY